MERYIKINRRIIVVALFVVLSILLILTVINGWNDVEGGYQKIFNSGYYKQLEHSTRSGIKEVFRWQMHGMRELTKNATCISIAILSLSIWSYTKQRTKPDKILMLSSIQLFILFGYVNLVMWIGSIQGFNILTPYTFFGSVVVFILTIIYYMFVKTRVKRS